MADAFGEGHWYRVADLFVLAGDVSAECVGIGEGLDSCVLANAEGS